MSSQEFTSQVTHIPADWANDVNDTVYDVFGAAKTASAARLALGLGTLATQNVNAVNFSGGVINGISVGLTAAAAGKFTSLKVSATPVAVDDAVNKSYLDQALSSYGALAVMAPSAVNFTGGAMSGITITGGTINGTPIGATNPATGRFTVLTLNTALSIVNGGTGASAFTGKYVTYSVVGSPHLDSVATIPNTDISGLGTMSVQNSNNVGITGGNINGVTLGGTVVYSGLGSLATQNANNVNITGGTLSNVTITGATSALAHDSINGATVLDPTKDLFICDGSASSYIVDLPDPLLATKPLYIKKIGSNRIDLRAPVGHAINGNSVYNLFSDHESVILISDGTNYHVF